MVELQRTSSDSLVSNDGRGLKLQRRHSNGVGDVDSLVSNDGRGLKPKTRKPR
jgi:hypothetical protein